MFLECSILFMHFKKAFIEFVTILFLFYMFWFFDHEACRILAPQPGIEPTLHVLEGEGLTTEPPGKSHLLLNSDVYKMLPSSGWLPVSF